MSHLLNINSQRLVDSLFELGNYGALEGGGVCPSGMIFVPCVGGISHNVHEHTKPADLIAGGNVLLQVVLKRAQRAA